MAGSPPPIAAIGEEINGFLDNCIAENGTVGTCRCVYRSVGDGVYRDGIPQLPDGNIDVDALVPDCTS